MEPPRFKILLVEDEPDFSARIKVMLDQAMGTFEVATVDNFSASLARLADGGFDLLLIDISLPDGAGLANIEGGTGRGQTRARHRVGES